MIVTSVGCSSTSPSGRLPTWQQPELLYVLPEPYDRVYVEVASVEGTVPPPEMIESLQSTLETYCSKPRGVKVHLDEPIPLASVKSAPGWLIAMEHIKGPPPEIDDGKTAFLYVLFYDSGDLGNESERPRVYAAQPSAIFIDVAWQSLVLKSHRRQLMVHEVGHVLGLCKNKEHGDGGHCTNKGCVMGPIVVKVREVLGLVKPDLSDAYCENCTSDLKSLALQPSTGHESFHGPFSVRHMDGYQVATLSHVVILNVADEWPTDWRTVLDDVRQRGVKLVSTLKPGQYMAIVRVENDLPDAAARLERAMKDPYRPVRDMANEWHRRLQQEEPNLHPRVTQP